MAELARVGGSWLPARQDHVLYTLGHVDATIARLADVLDAYLRSEPLQLITRRTPDADTVVLEGAMPLPEAVPRLFADALNQARNVLEHALYAEVEAALGRELTAAEARNVELPAVDSAERLTAWAHDRRRRTLLPLQPGANVFARIERLQPYHRTPPTEHPLQVLVAHTNFAKHREPAMSLTRVGRVDLDNAPSHRRADHQEILRPGAVLASVPRGTIAGISVWPQVVVRRPHDGQWRTLMTELGELENWVRTVAVPIVIAERTDLPALPPATDVTIGHDTADLAWAAAGTVPAAERATQRMVAEGLRRDLLEMLTEQRQEERATYRAWLWALTDAEVRRMFAPVADAARSGDGAAVAHAIGAWRDEATRHAAATAPADGGRDS